MAVIEDHGIRLRRGGGGADLSGRRWLALAVSAFVALVLLILSRLDHPLTQALRWQVSGVLRPAVSVLVWPIGPLRAWGDRIASMGRAEAEVVRLRAEIADLERARSRAAELERRVAELWGLVNAVRDLAVPHFTARVLSSSSGHQSESVMIGAGRLQGLRSGHPAVSGDGVAGRIVETGAQVARVLLLTDAASRIPVRIGGGSSRAILAGDAGRLPRLEYLSEDAGVAPGDEVTTSGVGGMFPRGLRVGTVERDGTTLRVKPHARLDRLEYLSILAYDNPALGLADEPATHGQLADRRPPPAPHPPEEGR